jgi:ribonucleotide reductase alpha subunit
LFCDFIQGPFVSRTEYLKANALLDNNETSGLYEDFFLKISQSGQESVICPDSMFHVNANKTANSDVDWKPFVKKWNLHTIHTPQGQTFTQSCNTQITGSRPSQALSPCALQLINSAIKNIMSTCEKTGVICELLGGTILGVVKLGKALPWEYDYDANFLATNCTKCKQLEAALYNAGFKFRNFATSCCKRKLKEKDTIFSGGSYKGKYGDFHGRAVLDSDLLIKDGLSPTKIILDGQWVNVPRNPGLSVRNRYGKEIYRHAEHWRFSGGEHADKMMDYTADTFLPCKHPGYHDCLDRFNTDGDLSFVEMLP